MQQRPTFGTQPRCGEAHEVINVTPGTFDNGKSLSASPRGGCVADRKNRHSALVTRSRQGSNAIGAGA